MSPEEEELRAEVAQAVLDYRRIFPPPWKLSANLRCAVHALALLDAERGQR